MANGMWKLQQRSTFFIELGTRISTGMIVGDNSMEQDMTLNVCGTKQLTSTSAPESDEVVGLEPVRILSLGRAIEWSGIDEYVEVSTQRVRLRKRYLALVSATGCRGRRRR
jgi:GTP-binding protein